MESIASAAGSAKSNLADARDRAKEGLKDARRRLGNSMDNVVGNAKSGLAEARDRAKEGLKDAKRGLSRSAESIANAFSRSGKGEAASESRTTWYVNEAFEESQETGKEDKRERSGFAEAAKQRFSNSMESIASAAGNAKSNLADARDRAKEGLKDAKRRLGNSMDNVVGNAKSGLAEARDRAKEGLKDAKRGLSRSAESIANAASNAKSGLSSAGNRMSEAIRAGVSRSVDGLSNVTNKGFATLEKFEHDIKTGAGELAFEARKQHNLNKDAMSNAYGGFKESIANAKRSISNSVDNAKERLAGIFGGKSDKGEPTPPMSQSTWYNTGLGMISSQDRGSDAGIGGAAGGGHDSPRPADSRENSAAPEAIEPTNGTEIVGGYTQRLSEQRQDANRSSAAGRG